MSLLHCPVASKPKRVEIEEGPDASKRFESTMGRLLRVSKEELAKREAAYQETNRTKPRRGPKPTEK